MFLAVKQSGKKYLLVILNQKLWMLRGWQLLFINLKDNQIVVCSKRGQNVSVQAKTITTQLETTNVPDKRHIGIKFYESCCKKETWKNSHHWQQIHPLAPPPPTHPYSQYLARDSSRNLVFSATVKHLLAWVSHCWLSQYRSLWWKPCFEKAGCFQFSNTRWVAARLWLH